MADKTTDDSTSSRSSRFSVATLRSRLGQLIWLVTVICALFLAIGALLVALDANPGNALVSFVTGGADVVDLGVFDRNDGIFTFDGSNRDVKNALVNWGLGAIAWLVVGRILDRLVRP